MSIPGATEFNNNYRVDKDVYYFSIPTFSPISIYIYNIRGELVEKLIHGIYEPGEYEINLDGDTVRLVLLKNGIAEGYENGKKDEVEHRWKVVEGEIHVTAPDEKTGIWRINKDASMYNI